MFNKILIAFLSLAAATTAVGQNTVMVNNSNATITYPLNFWSANAVQGRTGLGLGSAATNPASAFQPAALTLSNLASNNAVNLTNLRATNIVGVIPSSNIPTTTLTNISGTLAISSGGTGATNAATARTNLGLGTAATNPASAFQPSSAVLSNLAAGSGIAITNIAASNIVGAVAVVNGGTGATNAATARTNLGLGATDKVSFDTVAAKESTGTTSTTLNGIQWQSMYPSSNGLIGLYGTDAQGVTTFGVNIGTMSGNTTEVALFNLNRITFYVPLTFNNTTNAATTRTNLGLGLASSVAFSSLALSNGAATNLSLALGSTNRGFYATTGPERIVTVVGGIDALQVFSNSVETATGIALSVSGAGSFGTNLQIGGPLSFSGTNAAGNATATRTNLGLGWPALTNSNAGTGLVSVNTNGEVVSPTNFWQQAPIATTVAFSAPTTNSTNTATNSRNLIIQSLSSNINNTTNTLLLPTNISTFSGDTAVVIHAGGSGSATAIRQAGETSNLIVLTNFDHAVRFLYFNNTWDFYHNLAYVEPIYFSGTNAAANAAASRTNLGLGQGDSVVFDEVFSPAFEAVNGSNWSRLVGAGLEFSSSVQAAFSRTNLGIPLAALTNTNNADFRAAVELGSTNSPTFRNLTLDGGTNSVSDEVSLDILNSIGQWSLFTIPSSDEPPWSQIGDYLRQGSLFLRNDGRLYQKIGGTGSADNEWGKLLYLDGDGGATNARSALGLATTNNVSFSNVTASGTLTATGTVTATTNLVVNGLVNFSTNHTNSNPATNNQIQKFLQIRIGTNAFFLPLYQ